MSIYALLCLLSLVIYIALKNDVKVDVGVGPTPIPTPKPTPSPPTSQIFQYELERDTGVVRCKTGLDPLCPPIIHCTPSTDRNTCISNKKFFNGFMRYSSLRKHLTEDGKAVSPTTCYTHDRCVQFPSFTKDAAINMMKGKTVLFLGDSTMNQQHRYLLDMLGLLGTSHEAQEKTGGACHTPNQLHSVVVACNNDVLGDVALKDLGDKPITTPLTLESGLISSSMTHAMECVDGLWVDSQTNNNALFPHEPSLATNFFNPPDTPTPPCSKFTLECRYTSSPMDTTICFYEARHLNPDAWQIEALTSKLGIQKVDLIYFGAGAHFLHRGGTDSGTNYFAWPGNHGARGQPLDSYVHHGERMKAFIVRMFER